MTTKFPLLKNLAPSPTQAFRTRPHFITQLLKIQIFITKFNLGEIIGKGIYQTPNLYLFSTSLIPT